MKFYALGLIAGGLVGFGMWYQSDTRPIISLILALIIMGLGTLLLTTAHYRRLTRLAEDDLRGVTILSVGTAVRVTNPIASKGTYVSGDIAIIEELKCLPGMKTPFYKVRWMTPPPSGVMAHARVIFLAPNEVTPLASSPVESSIVDRASSKRITKPL